MNVNIRHTALLVILFALAGCTAKVATPWDRTALDPGQVVTIEPLEIPPDFDKLPEPKRKDENPTVPEWVDAGGQAETDGEVPSLFKTQVPISDSDPISRNEQEQLPSWIGPEVKSE